MLLLLAGRHFCGVGCTCGTRVRLETAEQNDWSRDGFDVLDVHFCVEEEPRVNGQHDETRQVETDAGRDDGVGRRQVEGALRRRHLINIQQGNCLGAVFTADQQSSGRQRRRGVGYELGTQNIGLVVERFVRRRGIVLRLVQVHGDGQERNEGRQKPNGGNGTVDDSLCHPPSVPQWIFDVDVP